MGRFGWGIVAAAILALPSLSACASEPEPPTAIFLGDSYTLGTALAPDQLPDRWASRLASQLHWREINAGCNGSGYTRPGLRCMTTYRERVATLSNADPDIVVVSGGINDLGATDAQIEVAVQATYLTVRSTFPKATIYAVSGISYDGESTPERLATLNRAVATAAEEVGAIYVDIGEPLLGRPDLLASDGLHPNSDGHAVIAELTSNVISDR